MPPCIPVAVSDCGFHLETGKFKTLYLSGQVKLATSMSDVALLKPTPNIVESNITLGRSLDRDKKSGSKHHLGVWICTLVWT